MNATPNSLGANSSNSIAVKYRGIDPSFIGNIDTNVCGSSDPGSSGVLTPFTKVKNLYFDESQEDQDGIYDFEKALAIHQRSLIDNNTLLIDILGDPTTGEFVSHDEYLRRMESLV